MLCYPGNSKNISRGVGKRSEFREICTYFDNVEYVMEEGI
jgi:hypothetical protein